MGTGLGVRCIRVSVLEGWRFRQASLARQPSRIIKITGGGARLETDMVARGVAGGSQGVDSRGCAAVSATTDGSGFYHDGR